MRQDFESKIANANSLIDVLLIFKDLIDININVSSLAYFDHIIEPFNGTYGICSVRPFPLQENDVEYETQAYYLSESVDQIEEGSIITLLFADNNFISNLKYSNDKAKPTEDITTHSRKFAIVLSAADKIIEKKVKEAEDDIKDIQEDVEEIQTEINNIKYYWHQVKISLNNVSHTSTLDKNELNVKILSKSSTPLTWDTFSSLVNLGVHPSSGNNKIINMTVTNSNDTAQGSFGEPVLELKFSGTDNLKLRLVAYQVEYNPTLSLPIVVRIDDGFTFTSSNKNITDIVSEVN